MERNPSPNTCLIPSPHLANLKAALAKAQGNFRTPRLNREAPVKGKDNRVLYTTRYADLEECIDCIRKPLAEQGLCFTQLIQLRGNNWYLVLELMHESGESKESVMPLDVKLSHQQLGGSLTYLKRYQLSAFFGIAADFDDDGNSADDNGNVLGNGKPADEKPPEDSIAARQESKYTKPYPKATDSLKATVNAAAGREMQESKLDKLMRVCAERKISNTQLALIIKRVLRTQDNLAAKDLDDHDLSKIGVYIMNNFKVPDAPLDSSGAFSSGPALL